MSDVAVSVSDWAKGISLSVLASVIGGASKLSIRQSWILQHQQERIQQSLLHQQQQTEGSTSDPERATNRDENNDVIDDLAGNESSTTNLNEALEPPCFWNVRLRHQQHIATSRSLDDGNPASKIASQNTDRDKISQSRSIDSTFATVQSNLLHRTLSDRRNSYPRLLDQSDQLSVSTNTSNTTVLQKTRCTLSTPVFLRTCGMIGMTFLNPLCSVLAMNYASPSILAPFSGLTLVWIIAFSGPIIQEYPAPSQILAASLITVGEIVVAVFGDHMNSSGGTSGDDSDGNSNSSNDTVRQVLESYTQQGFVIYCICMLVWMAILAYLMSTRKPTVLRRFAWGVSGGSITGFQNFLKDALTLIKACDSNSQHGLYTTTSNSSSSVSEELQHNGDGCPRRHIAAFILLAVLTAFGGLLLLTACMKQYDAAYSSAMFVGSFVVSASIMSAIHYHTFDHLYSTTSYIMYPVGLLILMVGVSILVMETDESDLSSPILDCVNDDEDYYDCLDDNGNLIVDNCNDDELVHGDDVIRQRRISVHNKEVAR